MSGRLVSGKIRKLLIIIVLLSSSLVAACQLGAVDYLIARVIFAPDHEEINDEKIGEPKREEINESRDKEITGHEGEGLYSSERIPPLDYTVTVVAEDLEIPWEILPLPDGRLLVTERPGRVTIVGEGNIATIHDVRHIGEGGLMGAEIDPDFEENSFLYLYYSYEDGGEVYNRVSRFVFQEDSLEEEKVLLDNIPGSRFHNGGRIRFGPKGALFITTGDASDTSLPQDLSSLAGKILRINPDGSIPENNPFPDNPVYSYGHRNPQGIAWDPDKDILYSSEHGPTRQDEVNVILPGKNYGWPIVECGEGESDFEDPIICYTEFTLAPSGMDFFPGEGEYPDQLFIGGLRGNMVKRIALDDKGNILDREPILTNWGRLRTVRYHEGNLYVATNDRDGRGIPDETSDLILKVEFQPD